MNQMQSARLVAGALAIVACSLLLAGCGGCRSATHVPNDEEKVNELVSHVADAASSSASFTALFAPGAAPNEQERARYGKFSYRAPDASISGDNATATVDIISPFTDQPVGNAEWTCVKQNGQWLLQTAPLPADLKQPSP